MNCSNCGASISEKEIFCHECGKPIEGRKDEHMHFYKAMWFITLMLIFIPPIGIFLIWKYRIFDSIEKRKFVSAIAIVWFIIALILGQPSKEEQQIDIVKNSNFAFGDNVIESNFYYGDLLCSKYFKDIKWESEKTEAEDCFIVIFSGHLKENGALITIDFTVTESTVCPYYMVAGTGIYGGQINLDSAVEAGQAVCGLVEVLAPEKLLY